MLRDYYNFVNEANRDSYELDRQICQLKEMEQPPEWMRETDFSGYIDELRSNNQIQDRLHHLYMKKASLIGKKMAIPQVERFMSILGVHPGKESGTIDDKVQPEPNSAFEERKSARASVNKKMQMMRNRHRSFFEILGKWHCTGNYASFISEYRSNHKDIDSLFRGIGRYSKHIGRIHKSLAAGNASTALMLHDYISQNNMKYIPKVKYYMLAKYRLEKAVLTAQRDYLIKRRKISEATKNYLDEFRNLNIKYTEKCQEIIRPKRRYFGRIMDRIRNFFSGTKYAAV